MIHAKLSTSAVTCCYALLPDKTEEGYKEMLKALLEKSADLFIKLRGFLHKPQNRVRGFFHRRLLRGFLLRGFS